MTKEPTKRIWLIYRIILCISIIFAGLCFMACSAHIYLSGDHTYTPVKVAAYFSLIAVPVYICLGLILLGFLLPRGDQRKAGSAPAYMVLARAKRKALAAGPVLTGDIQAEQKKRSLGRWLTVGVLSVAFVSFLLYGLNPANFTEDINRSVIRGFTMMAICLLAPLGVAIVTVYRNNASMLAEAELRKQGQANETIPPAPVSSRLPLQITRFAVLLAAVALTTIGLMGEGTRDVLTKAINICTECIGLG